ncbi:DUF485 domain-containing protein [Methylobacterium sp. E-065]|uniref:DUF485 domain-containing protein n=1 Tax=Methylobacterium sp. E-065 TaxID=2836583 RepID=UPI001FBA9C6B|nr:DUF485 domain-containing protein [Methylobacterium sp. E-065]MCJ2017788.1 DUF485 domain-containing protein [Methylobacterium sp. E-065]
MSPESSASATEPLGLGLFLMGLLAVAFFGFIGLCAFAPAWSAAPLVPGGSVNAAFVLGLGVIGLGVVLTGLYVVVANRAEARVFCARS